MLPNFIKKIKILYINTHRYMVFWFWSLWTLSAAGRDLGRGMQRNGGKTTEKEYKLNTFDVWWPWRECVPSG